MQDGKKKPKTLGQIISEYRSATGTSIGKFAQASGLSKSYIFYLESNETARKKAPPTPSIEKTLACCNAMGKPLSEVLAEMGHPVSDGEKMDTPSRTKKQKQSAEELLLSEDGGLSAQHTLIHSERNIPKDVPRHIPLTNETLSAAIREQRLLLMPSRIPRRGDIVFVPMAAYGMAVAASIIEASSGMFRASGEACGELIFTVFDLGKDVFTTRAAATAALTATTEPHQV